MPKPEEFLTPRQLADRWHKSWKTLSNWRCAGMGPDYFKAGGKVLYPLEAVEDYEQKYMSEEG